LFFGALIIALVAAELIVRAAIPVRNVGPTFSEYDPVYGKRLKRSFQCTRIAAEFTMQFSTNSLGFRGPEPSGFPSGGILFLGDSFTSGYGVNDGEEFPELVRRRLIAEGDPIPVVNAGSGNIGNGYWLRFLQTEGRRFSPRLVVLGFCVNDFADNLVDHLYELGPDGTLISLHQPPRQEGARRMQEMIEAVPVLPYSHLIGLARQVFSESSPGVSMADTSSDRLTWAIVDEVFAECERQGIPALLVTVGVEGARLAGLEARAARHRIPVVVSPSKIERPDLYYQVDGHWNIAGHAFMSREIMQPIVQALKGRP
jgi:lysophospholipase L1-like esterase